MITHCQKKIIKTKIQANPKHKKVDNYIHGNIYTSIFLDMLVLATYLCHSIKLSLLTKLLNVSSRDLKQD